MKKTLSIFFFLIFFIGDSYAENFKMGQKIENEFKFSKKVSFPLEPGVWEVINREVWFFGAVKVRLIGLILVENNEVVAFREFQEGKLSGGYQADLNISIHEYLYKGKYDGLLAYVQSKRCQVLLNKRWASKLKEQRVLFHSYHPGWSATPGVKTSQMSWFYEKKEDQIHLIT